MRPLVAAILLALAAPAAANAQNAGEIPIASGVFTTEQAARGERTYRAMCTRCHGRDLHAMITEVPSLTDVAFRVNWTGRTVGDLFTTIRYTMPAIARQTLPFERPNFGGYLDEEITADLVAYILSYNGFPAGQAELTPDLDRMGQMVITLPDPPAR